MDQKYSAFYHGTCTLLHALHVLHYYYEKKQVVPHDVPRSRLCVYVCIIDLLDLYRYTLLVVRSVADSHCGTSIGREHTTKQRTRKMKQMRHRSKASMATTAASKKILEDAYL